MTDPTRTVKNSTTKAVSTVQRLFRMILHQATKSGGFSIFAGRSPPGNTRRRSTRTSRGANTSILFWSLPSSAIASPLVNGHARGGLKGRRRTPIEHRFRRTVGNKNNVFGLQHRIGSLPGNNLAKIHGDFRSFSG